MSRICIPLLLQDSEASVAVVGVELDEIGHIKGGASEEGAGLRDEVDDCWRWPGEEFPEMGAASTYHKTMLPSRSIVPRS